MQLLSTARGEEAWLRMVVPKSPALRAVTEDVGGWVLALCGAPWGFSLPPEHPSHQLEAQHGTGKLQVSCCEAPCCCWK